MPAGEGGAGQGDHRHPHQQRFAGGQAAGVGPGVQGDVDAVVGIEKGDVVFRAFQHYALPLDAGGFEFRPQTFAEGGVAVLATLQQQPTVGNLLKQARPLADQLRVDLGRVVQAAEGHIAVCGGRQRAHRRRVLGRHIADVVVGHPDQLLQIVRVATRWRFHRVTD